MSAELPDKERFMEWWFKTGQYVCKRGRMDNAEIAWKEALSLKKRFACHYHYFDPDGDCVMDGDGRNIKDCDCAEQLSEQGKQKTDCEYWREIG